MAVNCPKCNRLLTKLTDLKEIHSLGIALRGTCPDCGAYVWGGDLFRVTRVIDRSGPAKTSQAENPSNTAGIKRPDNSKNALKCPNFKRSLAPDQLSAEMSSPLDNLPAEAAKRTYQLTFYTGPGIGLENQHLHKQPNPPGVAIYG